MGVSKFIKFLLKPFLKVIPICKNRIVFMSFGGHHSDSPKYISKKMHELAPELEQVWLVKRCYMDNVPKYAKCVSIDSIFSSHWYRATASVIVDNVYGGKEAYLYSKDRIKLKYKLTSFINNKRGQIVFTTWHGTPLKRMGRDQINSDIVGFSCPNTIMLMGNKFTLDIMKHLTFGKVQMELLGTPRNDILFGSEINRGEIKEKLGLPGNKKIILFAPTFRCGRNNTMDNKDIYRSGIDQLNVMDFSALLKKLSDVFEGEWVMVCRFHYHVEKMVNWEQLDSRIINGNLHDDMSEYLACTDVLLTDASSSMFDFALTKKPCFLFFPDLEYYKNEERGFYTSIEKLPFPVSKTFSELIKSINDYDEKSYIAGVDKMIEDYGYVDDINSSQRVVEYIIEKRNRNEMSR